MNIMISDNLKELRKKKNNTQEDLAEFLTVSSAAVSKWERGECYPDIEFLPKIASYYDISMDDLFGMGEIKKTERIGEYLAKDYEIFLQEDNRAEQRIKRVALWHEAQKEFPNNHTVLLNLVYALNYPEGAPSADFGEIVQIGERLIAESTDNNIRSAAIYHLCNACVAEKDFENAKRYANMVPSYHNSQEVLYGRCLSGEERVEYTQRCIVGFIGEIFNFINGLSGTIYKSNSISAEEHLPMYEFTLNLYQLLFPDGDFGDKEGSVATICHILANLYSGADNDKALCYLNKMADHTVKFWTQDELKHTSLMVNRLSSSGPYDRSKDSIRKYVGQDLKIIEETAEFASVRNDKRYTAAIEKLKNLLE